MCRAAAVALVLLLLSNEGPSLVVTTWGMPRDPRFTVELFENGRLRVTREAPPFTDDGQLTKKVIERRISRSKAQKILKLAADARDFGAGCGRVPEGTHASMVLVKDAKELRRDCRGADVWPNGKHARAMLNAINAVVPGEMRVY